RQRVQYAEELLKTETFSFDEEEKIVVNRKDMAYPKDLDEARQLWRERLRYEYLQERLTKLGTKKKPQAAAKVLSPAEASLSGERKPIKPKSEAEEIVDTLTRRYSRNLKNFTEWDSDDVLQIYLTALTHVYDPHSDYFGKAMLDSFSIQMNLSLF